MKKYKGILYQSKWDSSTWGLVSLTGILCVLPFFFDDDGWLPFVVAALVLIAMIAVLKGIYYKIDGENLVIYQFYIPKTYPIEKIAEIQPVKSYISAPATSFTNRIAIHFSDRKILKGTMPLVISPVRQQDFISHLKTLNPNIKLQQYS